MKYIAVFGSSKTPPGHPHYEMAYELANRLAREGYGICNGGYWGIMDAATRGARDAGGVAVGVTLEHFSLKRSGVNPLLTREEPKSRLLDRLSTLLDMSDAQVALPGGVGTLAEMFLSWNLQVTNEHKPLILLGLEWKELLDFLQEHTEIEDKHRAKLRICATAEESFEQIVQQVPLSNSLPLFEEKN